MVKSCVLKNCKKDWKPFSEVGYHSFPIANKKLFAKWTDNIPKDLLPNWMKNAYICSKHFEKSCFEIGVVRKILKKDAVPTIFKNFKNSDKHEDDTNTSINKTNLNSESSSQQPVKQPIIDSTDNAICVNSYKNIPDLRTVRKIDAVVQVESRYLPVSPVKAKLKKDIRALQQRLRRRDEALTALKLLLVQLKMYKGIK
ncbi:THAP domain-containing protein 1-like [Odontomachus brunneus]|uniref:THAP domain-containing protein 1-like n=1 Tax=Odontomachus brunneus TaxID=486640 RepID=UPI0013F1CD8A|nr:THAP domain-containing protein 1-like [Odontomachus brunneus]